MSNLIFPSGVPSGTINDSDYLLFARGGGQTYKSTVIDLSTRIVSQVPTPSGATTSSSGLMSASDKVKLNGIASGATKVTVNSSFDWTSSNPASIAALAPLLNEALCRNTDSYDTWVCNGQLFVQNTNNPHLYLGPSYTLTTKSPSYGFCFIDCGGRQISSVMISNLGNVSYVSHETTFSGAPFNSIILVVAKYSGSYTFKFAFLPYP